MTPLPRGVRRHSFAIKKSREDAVIDRRRALTSACILLAALTSQAAAQPAGKPVTIVVPYAAGGGTDTVSRLIAETWRARSAGPS